MKVLLVDQFGKTTGRDTLALAELINRNPEVNMEVFLSENTEIPVDRKYTVKIIKGFRGAYEGNIINKTINYLKALKELKKYIESNNIDIVHLQWFSLPWIEWIYVAALRRRHRVVITVHDVIPFDNRPFEMQSLDKIYEKADALVMHTDTSKNLFQKMYKAKTPISVVTQGFCLKSDYKIIDKKKAKEHFGIPKEAVVFLYYGTIRPSKGLDILIKSMHNAYKENKNVYLLAAGAFHRVNEEEYINMVKDLLDDGCAAVSFGFVPQEEEQWYFSAADVLCLPYLEVTQSGVAQLGLMYELPIIATDVGEMGDVCRDGQNGIVVKPGNQDELKDVIIKFTGNAKFREKASKISKELGEKEFSLEVKAEKVEKAYKRVKNK